MMKPPMMDEETENPALEAQEDRGEPYENPTEETGGMREVCVPLAALAMPDESEVLENPAVGDAVQFNAEGTISRVEGENAYVSLKSVNGKELPEKEETAEPTEEEQLASLETEARNQPDRYV